MKEKKLCIECDAFCECQMQGVCGDDEACEYFDNTVLSGKTDPEDPGNN